jgi:hypothetical protein
MSNRFDLEQQILDAWKVVDDINLAFELSMDNNDRDQMANLLLGLKTLYDVKFNKLWDTFEQCVRNKEL